MSDERNVLDVYAGVTLYAVCALHDDEDSSAWTPESLRIAPDGRFVCEDCWCDYGDRAGGVVVDEYMTPHWSELPVPPSVFDALRAERTHAESVEAENTRLRERVEELAGVVEAAQERHVSQISTMHSVVEETLDEFDGLLDPYEPGEGQVYFTGVVPTGKRDGAIEAIEDIDGIDRVEIDYVVDERDTAIVVYLEVAE